MPFPWKKVKNTKISQLVSDHLESQRRQRGHLVVETGFPTSLVDLFVKNHDRLKKPKSSKKKKKTQNIDNSSTLPSSSPFPLPQGPSPSPLTSPLISPTPSSSSLALTPAFSSSLSASYNGVQEADGVDEEMNKRPNAKGVIGAILRIFFVLVLALGAKKFAVGLTMSAFVLFLLEYVGKHSYELLVPCSEAKRRLRLLMQRILQVISFKNKSLDEDNSSATGTKGHLEACSEFNNHGDSSPICEIQIARPMFVEDIQGLGKEIGESSSDRRWEFQFEKEIGQPSCDGKSQLERSDSEMMVIEKEVKCGFAISESKKINSKRARMKLKMKRLIPRKLRGSKKEKRDLEGETSPIKEKLVAVLKKPEENEQGDARNLECDSKSSLLLSRRHEGNDQINMICSSDAVGEENMEEIVIREGQQKQRNSGYLILCLIVLIGLVGGRIIAFMLMVLWFLMLKSGEKLRRYIKLPVIRSLTEKSS